MENELPLTENAAKACSQCGAPMEDLFDCHLTTCHTCRGHTFYDISPAGSAVTKLPTVE
ncbi:hypothetical protein MJA45_20900 [Paenibacillus aurantius]|uniref:YhfH family protein n=1 Tax=Paenibacillus aurantius TaxID=2918900 RepID=A0AA96RE29_9BACL|nr:hypothetical protein [Paenibacillus aurantius]WJH34834.1 hypothetical protein N6H14_01205 [Paenibacillus sp. CC-CFT747]WNQ10061.1 hypothetical protein MJA45_20900 [Paenibacillus aurantius]